MVKFPHGTQIHSLCAPNDFPGIGEAGQRRLLEAHVTIIGVGATGSVLANHLARAGVGHLRIVDRDFVELNNLQRQLLYDEDDVAQMLPKAVAAARKLRRVNSTIEVEDVVADVNATNIVGLIEDADVVLDGTDNFSTRYLLNDACVKLGKPWVYCGVLASYGMTHTVQPGVTPCLRCIMGELPAPGTVATCDTAGIIGPIVALMGSIAAAEALKLLVGTRRSQYRHGAHRSLGRLVRQVRARRHRVPIARRVGRTSLSSLTPRRELAPRRSAAGTRFRCQSPAAAAMACRYPIWQSGCGRAGRARCGTTLPPARRGRRPRVHGVP